MTIPFAFAAGRIDPTGAVAEMFALEHASIVIVIDRNVAAANARSLRWDVMVHRSFRPRLNLAPAGGSEPGRFSAIIPLWIPLLPLALLWLAGRPRQAPFACRRCGYDLTGHDGPCPECGSEPR